jgi:hypothetical protein
LLSLDRSKAAELAKIVGTHFPVPRDFLDEAVEIIWPRAVSPSPVPSAALGSPKPSDPSPLPPPVGSDRGRGRSGRAADARLGTTPDLTDWERTRTSLRQAIVASATPDRHDRLFPGDIEQFATGGLNIAHGAAGVLYALDATGAGRYPEYERWMDRQALRPRDGTRLGLYDGLHGVAYVLDRLGNRARATDIIEVCLREKWERLGSGLAGGLAGIGLNLRHFAGRTGDADLRAAALWAADIAADRLGGEGDVPEVSGGERPHAGLFEGSSGPALLFIRMYEDTGDHGWLDRAAIALGQDLRRCVLRRDGTLHVNEGWRTMPYLHRGGAGVGLVLAEYLRHRHDQRFADAAAAIHRGVRSPLFVQSGLFSGRAGILAFLAWRAGTGRASADPDVMLQVNNLAWHALSYRGHLAFPGDQLHRLSMDLGTGSAGVRLALGAALHDRPVALPFIGVPGASEGRPGCHAGSATAP